MARPKKFDEKYIEMAKWACQRGATDQEIADFFKVCRRTIAYWKIENPKFAAAFKAGKKEADDRVERALFERATGYECDETDIKIVDGEVFRNTVRKCYPPDATSMIFWLKNRRPEQWRDKREVGLSADEKLADLMAEARKRASD